MIQNTQTLVFTRTKIDTPPMETDSWPTDLIDGWMARLIRILIQVNVFLIALKYHRYPAWALKALRELEQLRLRHRKAGTRPRYLLHRGKFFINLNTPGWPSRAFNRFVGQQLKKVDDKGPTLSLVILAITKKCAFQCEHCFEWNNLNKPDKLTPEDIGRMTKSFLSMGVSQVQLSGGEPLNRFTLLMEILPDLSRKTDTWLYTTGYSLHAGRAEALKKAGLTGVIISIDDHRAERHDHFRGVPGAWSRAMNAVAVARQAGLLIAFSCCTTRSFVSMENLWNYLRFSRNAGAHFVQFLEPRAVGHYAGQDVELGPEQRAILEDFYESIDKGPDRWSTPIVSFHGYHARRTGCSGRARDYVYVDTDGDVHACPFCSKKLFSALSPDLKDHLELLRLGGCSAPAYDQPKTAKP